MIPNKKTARIAGFLWLLMCFFGIFAQVFFRDRVFVTNDAAATAKNITENQFLFRAAFLSDLAMLVCYLLTSLFLYKLLSTVNKNQAAFMVILVITGTAIGMYNLLNEYKSLYLLSGAEYLNVFSAAELQAQALLSYNLYLNGYEIAHIFFSLWVLPLGLLVYKSGFIPRLFGILFVAETCTYIPGIFIHFLMSNEALENNLQLIGAFAEISFTLWLLFRGINARNVKALAQIA